MYIKRIILHVGIETWIHRPSAYFITAIAVYMETHISVLSCKHENVYMCFHVHVSMLTWRW